MGKRSPLVKDSEYHRKLQLFTVNSMVEVSSDEDGFEGAWYVGKILKINSRAKGKFLIQYQNLLCDEDPDKLLTETVDISFIRPPPPSPAADQTYQMHDIVDAFHNDGWWKGIVSKVQTLMEEETKSIKYTVVFEYPAEIFDFYPESLRFHFDWIDGMWVQPPKPKEIPCITQSEQSANADNVAEHTMVVTPVMNSRAAKLHNGEESSCKTMSGGAAHSKEKSSVKKSNPLNIQEESEQLNVSNGAAVEMESQDCASEVAVISRRNEYESGVAAVTGSSTAKHYNREKLPCRRMCDGMAYSRDQSSFKKSVNNPPDIQKESNAFEHNDQGELQNVSEGAIIDMESDACASKEAETFPRMENADADIVAKHSGAVASVTVSSATKNHNREKSSCKRICDRIDHSEDQSSVKKLKNNPLDIQKESNAFGHKDKGEQNNASKGTATDAESENGAIMEAEISCRMENAALPVVLAGDHTAEVGESRVNDDQVPSTYLASEEGHIENCYQSPAITVRAESELLEKTEMPFTKRSPLWKHLDSMDIFQFMPQNPHFSPLFKCNKPSREGFAIGHMWNFSNLVEMTSNLQADEPTEVFEDNLEALADLEPFGFNVKPVVKRTKKLLEIKIRQEQLDNELKDLQSKITQCYMEKEKVDEEIRAIDEKIRELEQKRAMIVCDKVVIDSKSNLLQQEANQIREDISNMKLDFEKRATAPW